MATRNLDDLTVEATDPIRLAMQRIDRNLCGIVVVVDGQRRLVNAVTDGDIRRAILRGVAIDQPISRVLESKALHRPVSARAGAPPKELLATMRAAKVQQLPLVDAQQHVVDLVTMGDLVPGGAKGADGGAAKGGPSPAKPLVSLTE